MNDGSSILFAIFALLTCGGAIAVVASQNVVRMAFWLIVSLGSTAGLFFLLEADFVGATQLLIYVGGTLVLLVFGVMLTASGPYLRMKTSSGEILLATAVGVMFLGIVLSTVGAVNWDDSSAVGPVQVIKTEANLHRRPKQAEYNPPGQGNTARRIGLSLLGLRPDIDLQSESGKLSTGYLLPFEIVSVHLLVVLVGAAYLARAKRRVDSS